MNADVGLSGVNKNEWELKRAKMAGDGVEKV